MYRLVLLRHGESTWNKENRFTGWTDVDLSDTHTVGNSLVSAIWSEGTTLPSGLSTVLASALSTSVSSDSTGSGSGSVCFTFSAADKTFDFLAAGQTLTVTYNITVTDNAGASSTQPVTITLTGTNDAPVLAVDASGPHGVAEGLSTTGTLTFTDVDLNDHHTVSTSVSSATLSGGATLPSGLAAVLPPLLFYSYQFYPEMLGALALAIALRAILLRPREDTAPVLFLGVLLAFLPWLHQKFLPVWAVLVAMAVVRAALRNTHIAVAAVPSIAPLFEEPTSAAQDSVVVLKDHAAEISALRDGGFDAALLLPNSFRSAWAAYRAAIPERWGFATSGRRVLLTRGVRKPRGKVHQSAYYRDLVRALGFSGDAEPPHIGVGPGTLALQNANTYTGATYAHQGRLTVGHADALGGRDAATPSVQRITTLSDAGSGTFKLMYNGNTHNHRNCPLILMGHGGGILDGGVHVKAAKDTPMANVFLTLLHGLGLSDLQSFGDSSGEFSFTAQETTIA